MNVLEKLLSYREGVHCLWTGNDGWLLWNGKKLIGMDLDLFNSERKHKPLIHLDILREHLDLLFITHAHEDHFNTETVQFLISSSCHFFIPLSCQEKMSYLSIDRQRITYVKPHDNISFDDLQIECVRAIHGHKEGTIYRNASLLDCGYIFHMENMSIYQPGDTVILEEHLSLSPMDVIFISPTEHNTLINDSIWLIQKLKPQYTIAQHFGTYHENKKNYFWSHGYVNELEGKLQSIKTQYIIPNENAIIHL